MMHLTCLWVLLTISTPIFGSEFHVSVVDGKANSVENAVISLRPLFESAMPSADNPELQMRQEGALFAPFVLPVKQGSTVSFPNFDEFRHHVYSFSKAKRFELRLYGQDESKKIHFDTPGAVALGCNIHDNMLAYIYVTPHPFFAKTAKNGVVKFANIPPGNYEIYAWHPDLKGKKEKKITSFIVSEGNNRTDITLELRRVRKKQLAPAEDDYN